MISFSDFRIKIQRKNQRENVARHFLGGRIAPFFSYFFAFFGFSPNQVTLIFFLTGLLGAFCYTGSNPAWVAFGYLCFRLHIIFDICDGDLARFFQKFSRNGAYFDYMIHSVLYPLYAICACYGAWVTFKDPQFLTLGLFFTLIMGLTQAVKSTFYRALYVNKAEYPKAAERSSNTALFKLTVMSVVKNIFNFEFFALFYCVALYFKDPNLVKGVIISSSLLVSIQILTKFFRFVKINDKS